MGPDLPRYPIARPDNGCDGRFTIGLALDVAAVLAHHNYPLSERGQSSITIRYASIREPRLGGCFLSFGHADSSAAVTVRKPTPCLRCSARLDIPDRASRRIAASRSTRERGCVIGGTPDVSTPWARLSAPGHRPGNGDRMRPQPGITGPTEVPGHVLRRASVGGTESARSAGYDRRRSR
jgi:hypothetical protein